MARGWPQPDQGITQMNQAEIAQHREYLAAMFKRRYPGAKMVWTQPLKRADTFLLIGKIEATGERWRARPMQATVYLPRSWREGAGYQFA